MFKLRRTGQRPTPLPAVIGPAGSDTTPEITQPVGGGHDEASPDETRRNSLLGSLGIQPRHTAKPAVCANRVESRVLGNGVPPELRALGGRAGLQCLIEQLQGSFATARPQFPALTVGQG